MKLIVKILLLAVLTLGPTMTPKAIAAMAGRPAFGPLTGEYAIGTYNTGHFFTARNGGQRSVDAVITVATSVDGPYERFRLETMSPNFTLIKTLRGYYVSATARGGLSGTHNYRFTFNTDRTSMADGALFTIRSDNPGFSPFTIQTVDNFYLSAIDGGGKIRDAFSAERVKYQGSWEAFQVLKCGDLGSDYDYAIRPKGFGRFTSPLQASYGGGRVKDSLGFFSGVFSPGHQRFKLRRQSDGSYSLRTSNLKNYVTAINGGGLASGTNDWDNLVADRTQVQAWEKFRIVDRGDCNYTIQTTNNWYVGWNSARGISTRISDPNGARSIGYTAYFQLIPFL